jgi:endo-1,4-beta-D-glucanase Y
MDESVERFYEVWKKAYLRHNCADIEQYYILDNEDVDKNERFKSICVSEGQGYGMLITVLMAGYDKDAHSIYDGLYKFVKSHPSKSSANLMAWSVLNGCVTNTRHDNQSSATDGDFDIALSLLMASAQWGDSGSINYKEEALKTLASILKHEINHRKHTVLLGDANVPEDDDYNDIRSSDFMPDHLHVFNNFLPDKAWLQTQKQMYIILHKLQKQYSPNAGLFSDFIVYKKGRYYPAPPNYLESKYDGHFYYNACRVPFRIALDKLMFGNRQADTLLEKFNDWIQSACQNNIDKITYGYYLNGAKIKKGYTTVPSFVCPIAISAMIDPENQEWLNDLWKYIAEEFEFKDYNYYDNTLQMLSMIIISGNYWLP